MSETGKVRQVVLNLFQDYFKTLRLNGIDLGFGGDPLTLNAIAMDMDNMYGTAGTMPQHLFGDARNLYWFKGNVFDYVYSSHLLEDFSDTVTALSEWIRVLRPAGLLVLYLPDEQKFRDVCKRTGQVYNCMHKVPDMGLKYMQNIFAEHFPYMEEIFTCAETFDNSYGFLMVLKKR